MRKCSIIGYCSDLGGRIAGSGQGPEAIRKLKIQERLSRLDWDVRDLGDVDLVDPGQGGLSNYDSNPRVLANLELSKEDLLGKNAQKILANSLSLADKVGLAAQDSLPVILGGDHTISIGTMAGMAKLSEKTGLPLGILWVDTHPDICTPTTSSSKNMHGMTIAAILGQFDGAFSRITNNRARPTPDKVAYVGLRDVDPPEKETIKRLKIPAFTMSDIDYKGLGSVLDQALKIVTTGTCGFLLSFDLDVCDPDFAPGTGTKIRGGLTYREAHLVMELAYASGKMRALEITELNPLLDSDQKTAELAASLLESAMGKSILS
jgi:arginase